MKYQHIQQIQRHIRNGHTDHRRDQQTALSGHLQERYQRQRAHGSRSADAESGQVVPGHLKHFTVLAGAHHTGQRIAQKNHRNGKGEGDRRSHRHGGTVSFIGSFPAAFAQGFSDAQLDAGSQHAADGADGKQQRIGKSIRRHGLLSKETADHDIINQQAEGNSQR